MRDARAADVAVEDARWDDAPRREEMYAIRTEVFVDEQGVPVEEELDGLDPTCRHVIARDAGGRAIGTARMRADGHIGRIAVVAAWRRRGVGSRLVGALLDAARAAGLARVDLDAQLQAIPFYETLGFEVASGVFMDAGIPHRTMVLSLDDAARATSR